MFNSKLREEALKDLDIKIREQSDFIMLIQEKSNNLLSLRNKSSHFITAKVQNYIRMLNNAPQDYIQVLSNYRSHYKTFLSVLDDILALDSSAKIDNEVDSTLKKTIITSVVTAVGTTTIAPTAAMAIASTFGTASTGTAIASLYGAAATNASLAVLGGGTLATGGAGIAGGSAFLALANPVGITIGVVGSATGVVSACNKNISIAEDAKQEIENINLAFYSLQTHANDIDGIMDTTAQHFERIKTTFSQLKVNTPNNYQLFSTKQENLLRRLIGQIKKFSILLDEKV